MTSDDSNSSILPPAQADYLAKRLRSRDALLTEMEATAAERNIPISHPAVGALLPVLARGTKARRALEIGTAIGYGAIRIASASPELEVVGLERDVGLAEEAEAFVSRAGLSERVRILSGEALELLSGLAGPFDFIYLDADKNQYRRLLDASLQVLVVGGLLVADNLLWSGQVAAPRDDEDPEAEVLRDFNAYFSIHPQLQTSILPLGDGVGVAVKIAPLVTDMGGPY